MLKLNIIQNEYYIIKRGNIEDPVKASSFKYQYHPSITNIDDIMKLKNIFFFSFQPFLIDKVKDIIKILNNKRYCPDGDITVKLIKINQGIFQHYVCYKTHYLVDRHLNNLYGVQFIINYKKKQLEYS